MAKLAQSWLHPARQLSASNILALGQLGRVSLIVAALTVCLARGTTGGKIELLES